MRAVIDSAFGVYFRCLLENGDLITVHKSFLPEEAKEGVVIQVSFALDEAANKKQQELMKKTAE